MATNNAINAPLPLSPTQGGTGLVSPTAHSLLIAEGASAFTALGSATNGQLPIGSTGADPVLATLTQGSGISITNAAGSITIASTGGALPDSTTWTPTLTPTSGTILYTTQFGKYVKSGKTCFIWFKIVTQVGAIGNGAITLTDLPFDSSSSSSGEIFAFTGTNFVTSFNTSSGTNLYGAFRNSSKTVDLYINNNNGSDTALSSTNNQIGASTFSGFGCYNTA